MTERRIALPPAKPKRTDLTIRDFNGGGVFDPAATEAMGHIEFELVCKAKPKASRQLIATRIIEHAKAGERDAANCLRK